MRSHHATAAASKESNPRKVARRLDAYLKSSYGQRWSSATTSAIHWTAFLFDRKQGHREQFAAALAIMLRTQGIPTAKSAASSPARVR